MSASELGASSTSSAGSDKRPTTAEDRSIPLGIVGKKKLNAPMLAATVPSIEQLEASVPADAKVEENIPMRRAFYRVPDEDDPSRQGISEQWEFLYLRYPLGRL